MVGVHRVAAVAIFHEGISATNVACLRTASVYYHCEAYRKRGASAYSQHIGNAASWRKSYAAIVVNKLGNNS